MHDESGQPEMNSHEPELDAFSRFVAGESDPAEAQAMDAWLARHPTDVLLAASVKARSDRAAQSANLSVDVESAWRAVQARMDAPAGLSVVRGNAPRTAVTKPAGRNWTRYAVGAAATLVALIGVRQWQRHGIETGAAQVVATKVGVRDSLTLPDGSHVVLAPGSRLTVAAGFANGERSVTLEGAAYFHVKHDDAHPFTVRAADAVIRDIGTSFSVKTDASGVSVSVTQGIVAVRESSSKAPAAVELRAGDRGVISAGTVEVSRGTVTADDMAWTHGQLTYRDASLAEVQADLKRWYGITLQVADSSLLRLTVTMPKQTDSARVISTIAALLGADAEQHGDTVILHSAGRSTTP